MVYQGISKPSCVQDRTKTANLPQDIMRLVGDELVREFKLTNGSDLTAKRSQVTAGTCTCKHISWLLGLRLQKL